jgi:hypothetical protein
MSSPGSTVYSFPGPIGPPPTGVASAHVIATVTGAAGTLGSFISGGIPVGSASPAPYPKAVTLFVIAADSAQITYISYDGLTVPSAANGVDQVPVGPITRMRIEPKAGSGLQWTATFDPIQLYCAGTAHLHCFFEW